MAMLITTRMSDLRALRVARQGKRTQHPNRDAHQPKQRCLFHDEPDNFAIDGPLSGMLFGVSATDLWTLSAVPVALFLVALWPRSSPHVSQRASSEWSP
jgi:hypothetical protein